MKIRAFADEAVIFFARWQRGARRRQRLGFSALDGKAWRFKRADARGGRATGDAAEQAPAAPRLTCRFAAAEANTEESPPAGLMPSRERASSLGMMGCGGRAPMRGAALIIAIIIASRRAYAHADMRERARLRPAASLPQEVRHAAQREPLATLRRAIEDYSFDAKCRWRYFETFFVAFGALRARYERLAARQSLYAAFLVGHKAYLLNDGAASPFQSISVTATKQSLRPV